MLAARRSLPGEVDDSKGNGQMNKSLRSPHMFIFAVMMVAALPSASPAQVRVLISGGFSAAYQELLPQFEKSTGITVTTAPGRI
jgi:ABC-type molybdate transport system substrate-binding protein